MFLIIFCETGLVVTPFLPGDSLLFVSGAVASLPGMPLEISLLMMVIFIAAALGDSCNYLIGHYFGKNCSPNQTQRSSSKVIWRKPIISSRNMAENHNHCPFCPHCPHFCTVCRRNGTHELLLVYDLQPCRGSCLGLTFCMTGYFFGNIPFVQQNLKILLMGIVLVSLCPALIEYIRIKINEQQYEKFPVKPICTQRKQILSFIKPIVTNRTQCF